jgi:tetratricopeptide (TPR) repeat protein
MSDKDAKKLHEAGVALFRKGKAEAALEKLMQAADAAALDSRRRAEIFNDLGVVYRDLKDYEAAHQSLDEAMQMFEAMADEKGQAQTLGNRGAVLEAEGDLNAAVEVYKQSAQMLEAQGEADMAMYVWQAVSRLRAKQGQYIAAIGAYEEGVENLPKNSLKRKVLERILKTPGSLLGNAAVGGYIDPSKDKDDD